MPTFAKHSTLVLAALTLVVVVFTGRLHAADQVTHIRLESDRLQAAMEEAAQSQTFRELVDRINDSDLIVYVRCQAFTERAFDARLALIAATTPHRYVLVEIACSRIELQLPSTLAHELRHAVEVAGDRSVVDQASFKRLYTRIGFDAGSAVNMKLYETTAAIDAAARVRREIDQAHDDAKHVIVTAPPREDP
jgi:hypothetical protein